MRPELRLRPPAPIGRWISISFLLLSLYAVSLLCAIGRHHRTKSAIRRQLLPEQDALTFKEMPRVTMVFFSIDGSDLTGVWNNWYDQWLTYMKEHGAKHEIDENASNPYLQGVLYRNPGTDLEQVKNRSPKFVQNYIVKDPVLAKRFRLLNATRQVFEYALESFPDSTHYSFVSASTIPLKPFSYIWSQLSLDSRSKLDIFCVEHREGYPKHSQWITLRKEHAKALVAEHKAWKDGVNLVIRGTCPTLCAANDEYWPARIIAENLHYNTSDAYYSEFDGRLMQHPLGTLNWRTYIDWGLFASADHGAAIGDMDDMKAASHPRSFKSITSRFLRMLVATENIWFARKFPDDLMKVTHCNDNPLSQWGDALGGELRRVSRAMQSPAKMPYDFGPPFDCALNDFLSILLREGAWAPIVGHDIPSYLKDYVTFERDKLTIGKGGLFAVRHSNGTLINGGLDQMLAGTLLGSDWTNGTGLQSRVVVEFRPLYVTHINTLAESKAAAEREGRSLSRANNIREMSARDIAIWSKMEFPDTYQESDDEALDNMI